MKLPFGSYEFTTQLSEKVLKKSQNYLADRHSNIEYELFVILEGEYTIDVEDNTYSLSKGDAILIAPNKFHCPVSVSPDMQSFVFPFTLSESTEARVFHSKITPCIRLCFSEYQQELCKGIIHEIEDKKLFWEEAATARYSLLVSELLRIILSAETKPENNEYINLDTRFATIDTFFEENYNTYGAEELLANKLHISRRQLNRILTTYYGLNFRQKLLGARMDRAAWLLRTTDMSATKVGEAVGYISSTSFFKAFRTYHKTTPKLYRKGYKKNGHDIKRND